MKLFKKLLIKIGLIEPSIQDLYDAIVERSFTSDEIKMINETRSYDKLNTNHYSMYTDENGLYVICNAFGPLTLSEIQEFVQNLSTNVKNFKNVIASKYLDQGASKLAEEKLVEETRIAKQTLWKSI